MEGALSSEQLPHPPMVPQGLAVAAHASAGLAWRTWQPRLVSDHGSHRTHHLCVHRERSQVMGDPVTTILGGQVPPHRPMNGKVRSLLEVLNLLIARLIAFTHAPPDAVLLGSATLLNAVGCNW